MSRMMIAVVQAGIPVIIHACVSVTWSLALRGEIAKAEG